MQNLEKPSLIKIYEILTKNKQYLHIESDLLDKIEELISEKIENDECIILQPCIDDLFENNLYKLTINQHIYIVPLWHTHMVYDNSGNDVYVKCFPILDDHIEIDKHNNIHIQHKETLDNIVDLRRKSADQIHDMLSLRKYAKIEDSYKYLTKMPMDSVNNENVQKLYQHKDDKTNELVKIKSTSIEDMWLSELHEFETHYHVYTKERALLSSGEEKNQKKGTKKQLIIE